MKSKITGIILIIGSLWYIIAEAICAFTFNDTLANTYLKYTISTLGIPNLNSPYFFLMNSAFILLGLIILFSSFYKFKDYIIKNKIIYYIFTITCGLGFIIVGLIHSKSPLTSHYHVLGANMAILGGNILLLIISKSMDRFKSYQEITLVLGIIGLIGYGLLFFNTSYMYRPIFERLSVYTLIIWSFMTGVYLRFNLNL
ncbi:DUF998 domain-containing protein [uncultured Methanobrevibacter sp.]|uniref:DUF998 domain-containing protein n=1 Tax=uncultured Methanobrevibacter sp. TaxID=253161 RepID=UPI0025CFAD60|nr:DUF998 domain-containing protein [uncultured Methanobrevibacter sp.]